MCTKCKDNPRADQDPKATNRHCTSCRSAAVASNREVQLEREHGKGFVRGVQLTKEVLAGEFRKQGGGYFNGFEIEQLILGAAGPVPTKEESADDGKEVKVPDA